MEDGNTLDDISGEFHPGWAGRRVDRAGANILQAASVVSCTLSAACMHHAQPCALYLVSEHEHVSDDVHSDRYNATDAHRRC
jgi:hypothetical protein